LNTITENWLLLNVVWYILLSVATFFVMWYYSEKNLPWHIRISVFIALGASLSIVIMVPWDVSNVYQQRCQNATFTAIMNGREPSCPSEITTITKESQTSISDFLNVSWNVVYYITNLQGWFLLQVQQAYNDAGQFTRWGRFRQALKENVAVLVFLAAVLAVMVGYNVFIEKQDDVQVLLVSLKTLVAFLSQATVCALLGHGLIEVPRYYWSRRNTETWLDKTYSELVRLQMNQESARKELKEKMRLLSHYNINVRQQMDSDFGALIDMTMQTVPPGLNIELPDDGEIREMEYNANDHNADALVSLNASIKGAVTSFCRASAIYNRACVDGCFLEDVVLTKSYRQNNDGVITSNLRKQARST